MILLVVVLFLCASAIRRGGTGARFASWALSVIMFMNGIGHLAGSAYFQRWLPGATTAPLLLVTSTLLAMATWQRRSMAVA